MLAVNGVTLAIKEAQVFVGGNTFGDSLWVMSRQVWREVTRLRDYAVNNRGVDPASEEIVIADDYIQDIETLFFDPNFFADSRSQDRVGLVRDLVAAGIEAYYYVSDTLDQCNQYGGFPLPDVRDPVERVQLANDVNGNCNDAFNAYQDEMERYVAEADGPPGVPPVQQGIGITNDIQPLMSQPIAIVCDPGTCITDADALQNELYLMDLVDRLDTAAQDGVWTRNWQHCMVNTIKFRIELSVLRVEFACGVNNPISIRARQTQADGLDLVAQREDALALRFYMDQRCLILETYNECLVNAFPAENDPVPYPQICENQQAQQ
jgi:hypothetical protein